MRTQIQLIALVAVLTFFATLIFAQVFTRPGATSPPLAIGDVTGLSSELASRPVKSPTYTVNRTAKINPAGQIESLTGESSDCVRVDGTAAPCPTGGGGGTPVRFADDETPAGSVNGTNASFTLANIPTPEASLLLFRNGLRQRRNVDYTIANSTITFLSGSIPQTGDQLAAHYRY